jgi:hypothetical protein
MPVILTTQETEIRRISVLSLIRKHFMIPYVKKNSQKWAGGVAQGVGTEFKP